MTDKYTPPIYDKYEKPNQVKQDASLSLTEKREILETWAEDARSLVEASAEGMTASPDAERPRLAEIEAVLLSLDS